MGGSSAPYSYLHIPFIHELGVLIPFTPFRTYFLETVNVSPSHLMPNMCSILKAFGIISCNLGVTHTLETFLSFHGVEIIPICGWITLRSFSGSHLL